MYVCALQQSSLRAPLVVCKPRCAGGRFVMPRRQPRATSRPLRSPLQAALCFNNNKPGRPYVRRVWRP